MPTPARILFASSNPHKVAEVRAILSPLGIEPDALPDASIPEPVEDADTFEANARLKAIYYAQRTGRVCLADDSGLEVDALDGAPGVHSAYFAHGAAAAPRHARAERDAANNAKLLSLLAEVPDDQRAARFVCVMAVAAPSGAILATARGHFDGRIGRAPRGANGFGYDPLLVLPDGRTSAELPPDEKNTRSHRAAAARAIAPRLRLALGAAETPPSR